MSEDNLEKILEQSDLQIQIQKNQETKFTTNGVILAISNQVKFLTDDLSEIQIPSHFLPSNIQIGNIYKFSFQRQVEEEKNRKDVIDSIYRNNQQS
ncbi:hypothetical protein pb186bvf_008063 [Paramecium bursaria]